MKEDDWQIIVFLDRFPSASPEKSSPGTPSEPTPRLRFMQFVRKNAETNIAINQENEAMKLSYEMTPLEWWKNSSGKGEWQVGKTHPNFNLVDWFVAASLAYEFLRIILPKISLLKQQEIQKKIIQSFELHKQSMELLEKAKHIVEITIEDREPVAMAYLDEFEEAI